ncbi:MAG: AAA family ATPase, partial [bacterium]|nr:AAA family ATPase [bacterium]
MGTIQLCEACRGIGNVRGKKCRTCGGFGAAAQLGESKLFWSRQIDFAGIAAARFQRIVRVFVSLVAISIFCISIGFVAGLLINNNNPEFIFQIAFWKAPSPSLFWLWTGALTGLYLISRSMRASEGVRRVPRRKYKQAAGELAPVSFEELRAAHRSGRIAIDQAFSAETLRVIERAFELANRSNHAHLLPMHLVQASLKTTPVQLLFGRMGIAIDRFAEPLGRLLERQPARQGKDTEISPDVFTVLFEAYQLAYEKREPMVRSLALFDAAVHADANVREILFDLGVEEETLLNVGAWIRISELLHERYRKFRAAAATRPKGGMDRAMTAMATPNLDQVSRDLTRYAAAGVLAPLINREDELAEMFRIFEGGASGVLLVGQPGVGKRALVEGLAQRMVEEDVPAVLSDKRMVELSVAELVSGVDPSAAQKRLLTVLSEVARAGNIVLVIPDAGGMVGVSVGEGIDLADAFAGELQKGYFQCIATATEADYAAKLEQNALGRSLERIRVEELSEAVAIQVLEAKSGAVEARQRVYFSYAALERAVRLSARYLHERFLPEKAIEIMTEAATSVRATRGERQIVSGEDVATIISQ